MNKIIALALLVLLLLHGCTTEYKPLELQEQMEVSQKAYYDIGDNGDTDLALVEFTPLSVVFGDEKFTIKRTIFLYSNQFKETHVKGVIDSSKLQEAVSELDSSFNNIQASCSDKFNSDLCLDAKSCTTACSYGSTMCSRSVDDGIGVVVLDFSNHIRKLQAYITSLKEVLSTETGLVPNSDVSEYVAGIYLESEILKNHPAKRYLPCNFGYLKTDKMEEIASDIGLSVSPLEYNSIVFMELKGYQLQDLVDINIKERLPSKVYSKTIDLSLRKTDRITQNVPLEIEFAASRLSGIDIQVIPYTMKLKSTFNPIIMEEWKNAVVMIKFISYEIPMLESSLSFIFQIEQFFYRFTQLSYFSFSISLFFGVAVFFVLWEVIKVVYFVFIGFKKGRKIKDSIDLALGNAKEKPLKKAAKAVVVLVIALVIEMFVIPPYKLENFSFYDIKEFLESNSFAPIAVGIYLYALFVFGDILADIIKGKIVGKAYYRNLIESTPKINKLRLEKLKELIAEAKKELDEFSAKGIEVSEEYDVIIRIPIEELEANVEKEDPYLMRGRLDKYIEEIKEVMSSLKVKKDIASKNWPTWRDYIASELEKREVLNFDTLLLIPHQWRVWAITRYMEENPEEDLVLEGKLIKRKATSVEDKIKRLVSLYIDRNVLVGAIVLRNYKPVAYGSTLPKEGVMLNILFVLYGVAIELASLFKPAKVREFKAYGKKHIIGAVYYENYHIIYISLREKEKDLKELFVRLKKFNKRSDYGL